MIVETFIIFFAIWMIVFSSKNIIKLYKKTYKNIIYIIKKLKAQKCIICNNILYDSGSYSISSLNKNVIGQVFYCKECKIHFYFENNKVIYFSIGTRRFEVSKKSLFIINDRDKKKFENLNRKQMSNKIKTVVAFQ